jgi:hypothetical protein
VRFKDLIDENFKDGRHPEDKGDSARHGIPKHASISTLRKIAKQGGRRGQLAHWQANMRSGRRKKKMNESDLVSDNIAYHKELSPAAWSNGSLRPEVRFKLLKTAQAFISYLDIPNFKITDVVLTGSMCNYNYTQFSDFDVHVVTRYSDLQCDDIAEAFYRAKKELWNNAHDVIIHNHDVELYVEDVDEPPVSAGVYSLLDDNWLKEPQYAPPTVDDKAVNAKVVDLMTQIDRALDSDADSADIQRLREKIRKMRRSGLDREGEFGVENLAFKVLRNMGYLDKISKLYNHKQDQELSL